MSGSDSILDRYTNKVAGDNPADQTAEDAVYESSAPRLWLVTWHSRSGSDARIAIQGWPGAGIGYAWLMDAEFDPSAGITLRFSDTTVRITGRNLNTESRPRHAAVQRPGPPPRPLDSRSGRANGARGTQECDRHRETGSAMTLRDLTPSELESRCNDYLCQTSPFNPDGRI